METVFIGFGSNLGDREANCRLGMKLLEENRDVRVVRVSPLYTTQPVGYTEQGWFVNGAAELETSLEPEALLDFMKDVERAAGRTSGGPRFGPRVLDLDILLYGDRVVDLPHLAVPHPRMHERRFVLAPLADLEPDRMHPVLGRTLGDLLEGIPENGQKVLPCSSSF